MAPCQLPAMSDQAEQRPSLPAGLAGRFRRWLTRCPAYLVARWLTRRDRLVGFARCKAVKADALYRPCLSSTCTGGHIHRKKTNPVVKCKICGSLSCYDPHMPWHAGYSCDSVRFFFDRVSPAAICFFYHLLPQAKSLRTSEGRLNSIAKKVPWHRMWGLHREGRRVQQHVPAVDASMFLTGVWFQHEVRPSFS